MPAITTIRISADLRDRLASLKVHPKEPFEDVIERLIKVAIDDEPLSDETIRAIGESLADIKAGRVQSLEDVADELGLLDA